MLDVGDATFACLRCGCRHGPDSRLPVYCTECFDHLHMYGYSDPTEDLAVVHYVYWGQQLEGLSDELARRVLKAAPSYEVRLHELGGYRF